MRLPTLLDPSYHIVGSVADAAAALRPDGVSVVQLKRPAIACCTQHGWKPSDMHVSLTVGEASQSTAALVQRAFVNSPESVRADIRMLIELCAAIAQQEGADSGAMVRARLLVTKDDEGAKCPRLHYDKVALRLACTYIGDGTRWLPASGVNTMSLMRLIRPTSADPWLKQRLLTDTRLYNAAVRWPWSTEWRTETGHVLFMKGSGWRAAGQRVSKRALPVMHRSPSKSFDDAPPSRYRALFTVDFGGDREE